MTRTHAEQDLNIESVSDGLETIIEFTLLPSRRRRPPSRKPVHQNMPLMHFPHSRSPHPSSSTDSLSPSCKHPPDSFPYLITSCIRVSLSGDRSPASDMMPHSVPSTRLSVRFRQEITGSHFRPEPRCSVSRDSKRSSSSVTRVELKQYSAWCLIP